MVYFLPFQAKKMQRIFYLNLNSMRWLFFKGAVNKNIYELFVKLVLTGAENVEILFVIMEGGYKMNLDSFN